jgi:AcrR family transcriptional regulator
MQVSTYSLDVSTRRASPVRQTELVDAALQIIATQGIAALSTRSLATAVGLSSGAIFRHFASLAALLDAVVARVEVVPTDVSACFAGAAGGLHRAASAVGGQRHAADARPASRRCRWRVRAPGGLRPQDLRVRRALPDRRRQRPVRRDIPAVSPRPS